MSGVTVEERGAIWVVTITRPEVRNAVDRATAEALADAFRAFEASNAASVAILQGASNTFCAGADLKAVAHGEGNRVEEEGDGPMGPTRLLLSKPVIAAIEGHAVAGGLELALWCDLRVMARDATLGVFCRRFGVPLIDGGTVRLPRLIGLSRALDLILTGRAVQAEEAHHIGLVHRVVEPGSALLEALKLAEQLASFPQRCMRADRLSAYTQHAMDLEDALRHELRHGLTALTHEGIPGARRFESGAGRSGQPLTPAEPPSSE